MRSNGRLAKRRLGGEEGLSLVDILEREGDSVREEKTKAMTRSLARTCTSAGSSAACRAVPATERTTGLWATCRTDGA